MTLDSLTHNEQWCIGLFVNYCLKLDINVLFRTHRIGRDRINYMRLSHYDKHCEITFIEIKELYERIVSGYINSIVRDLLVPSFDFQEIMGGIRR